MGAALAAMGFRESGSQPLPHKQMRYVMGTLCEITIYDEDPVRAERAMNQAFEEMQRVDRLLSNYDPHSELSRMNRTAAAGPFKASVELFQFVTACQRSLAAGDCASRPARTRAQAKPLGAAPGRPGMGQRW